VTIGGVIGTPRLSLLPTGTDNGPRSLFPCDDIDFTAGKLRVRRAKGGTTGVHPVGGRELRALRKLKCETPAST
jgi:hypothetical protein